MLRFDRTVYYFKYSLKWLFIAVVTGITGGITGSLFVLGVTKSNEFWYEHRILTLALPLAGLLIIFLYNKFHFQKAKGTNRIIETIRDQEETPVIVGPLIFVATLLTHAFGGSAGREGAAVQIGGSIGAGYAKALKLDHKDRSLAVICGVSAVFAALFNTPLTAVFFALEVTSVGILYYAGLLPCIVSSLVSVTITRLFGIEKEPWDVVVIPEASIEILLKVAVIGLVAALVSIVIVVVFNFVRIYSEYLIMNQYLRVFVGGLLVIGLSFLFSSGDYNGSGTHMIFRALEGQANWWDFPVKLLFTAITLGFGFKGGEIVPTFFMGAVTGCCVGNVIGLDPGFAAAMGLVCAFCGAVNCPVASIVMAMELFGSKGLLLFGLGCAVSYTFSGYFSLYSSQKIVYSKTRAEYINTNSKSGMDTLHFDERRKK